MTRLSLGALLASLAAGPWGGCDLEPVTPPAAPPPERAPGVVDDGSPAGFGESIMLHDARRRG
jgi:hypothetical protein